MYVCMFLICPPESTDKFIITLLMSCSVPMLVKICVYFKKIDIDPTRLSDF